MGLRSLKRPLKGVVMKESLQQYENLGAVLELGQELVKLAIESFGTYFSYVHLLPVSTKTSSKIKIRIVWSKWFWKELLSIITYYLQNMYYYEASC